MHQSIGVDEVERTQHVEEDGGDVRFGKPDLLPLDERGSEV